MGRLAIGAEEDLFALDDTDGPRRRTLGGIGLDAAAAMTGHLAILLQEVPG
jgi:hypothetical protein